MAPLAGSLHGVLEVGLEDGPVHAFGIEVRDVSRQLFNVQDVGWCRSGRHGDRGRY